MKTSLHLLLIVFTLLCAGRVSAAKNGRSDQLDSLYRILPALTGRAKAQVLNDISSLWVYENADSSRYYARRAFAVSAGVGADKESAEALQNIGISFRDQGVYDSAIHYLTASRDLWQRLAQPAGMAAVYNDLGIAYDEKANNRRAIELYLQSVKLYEQLGEKSGQAKVYNNLGIIYKKEEQYEKSLRYYSEALKIYEQLGSELGVAISNGNIGSVLVELESYTESIYYSENAIEGYQKLGLSRYVPYSMTNIGMACFRTGKLEEARRWYEQSIVLYQEFGNRKEKAFSLNGLSEVHYALHDYRKALGIAEEAFHLATELGAADEIRLASKSKALALEALQRFPESLQAWKVYTIVNDSLLRKERTRAIAELQTEYETEKKEQEIFVLKAEAAIKDLQVEQARQTTWLLILSIVLVLALVGGAVVRHRYRQKVKESEERKHRQQDRFRAVIETEEKERKRIAQELHDGIGQVLTAARLNLSLLEGKVGEQLLKPLGNSAQLLNDAIGEIRTISHNMMPRALAAGGFSDAVKDTVEKINATGKVQVLLSGDWEKDILFTEEKATALYRIIQELLNNSLKYSEATAIHIDLQAGPDGSLSLLLADNGHGFDTSLIGESTGIGWKSIFSRVEMINGEIDVQSRPAEGTEVRLRWVA